MAATAAADPMTTRGLDRPLRRRPLRRGQALESGDQVEDQQDDGRQVELRIHERMGTGRDQAADDGQGLGARVRRLADADRAPRDPDRDDRQPRDGERAEQPGLRQDLQDAGVARGQDGKVVIRDRGRRPDAGPRTWADPDER